MRMGQHEGQRVDEVRRRRQQPLALLQRLAHQREFIIFQIAQPAVNELGRGGGGVRRQIVALDEHDRQPVQRRLARNGGSVDAAADDQEIIVHRYLLSRWTSACESLCEQNV